MTNGEDIRKTLRIAWPVIIGQLSYISLGVIDSMMVGRLGPTPLAAAALANSYFAIPLVFCFGLAAGIAPIAASQYAQRNEDALSGLLRNGTWATLFAGLICSLLMISCIFVLPLLNQPPEVVEEAEPYIYMLALSIIPQALFLNYKNFTEGLEWMKPALLVGILSIPLNFVLNYLLIFGKLGFPAMGLLGAGLATLITRVLMTVGIHVIVNNSVYKKYINFKWQWDIVTIRKILSIGIPAGFQYVFETAAFATAAILMGILGTIELAAHQIAINLASIPFMVCIGLSAAASIRMGNAFGNQNWQMIRHTGKNVLWITVVFMAVSALLLITFRHFLPTLYIDDEQVIQYAANMLFIAAIFQLSDGLQAVSIGLLRGIEDVKWPTFLTLFAYWVIAIPVGSFFGFYLDWGYQGIWLGLLTGLSLSALLLLSRFYSITRKKGLPHYN